MHIYYNVKVLRHPDINVYWSEQKMKNVKNESENLKERFEKCFIRKPPARGKDLTGYLYMEGVVYV